MLANLKLEPSTRNWNSNFQLTDYVDAQTEEAVHKNQKKDGCVPLKNLYAVCILWWYMNLSAGRPPLRQRSTETVSRRGRDLRVELTKNGEKWKDKEATDHNQCSIERTKSFSETKTKRADQHPTSLLKTPWHKALETVFQDLDRRAKLVKAKCLLYTYVYMYVYVFVYVYGCREHNTWMNEYRQPEQHQIHYEYAQSWQQVQSTLRNRPRQVEACSKLNCRCCCCWCCCCCVCCCCMNHVTMTTMQCPSKNNKRARARLKAVSLTPRLCCGCIWPSRNLNFT